MGIGHGFEELRVDTGRAAFAPGVLVRRAIFSGCIALRHFGGDQAVEGPQRRIVIDGDGGLRAGLERGTTAAIGEADQEAIRAAVGFQADVVNLVAGTRSVEERGLFGWSVGGVGGVFDHVTG